MSLATARSVTDHELFRVFSFGTWEARETPKKSQERLQRLKGELHRLGWIPDGKHLPDRGAAAGWKQRLWGEEPPRPLDDGWLEHRVGISYPEELLVYVGLLRREELSEDGRGDWIRSTTTRWNAKHRESTHWATAFAMPDRVEHDNRPRLYGQAWVWTGEWNDPPGPDGWEGFGSLVYGPGRYSIFPWGLLGYTDDPEQIPDGLPRFDLHTTRDAAAKAGRDRFLYWELPRLLSCFVKADQFLRHRHAAISDLLDAERRGLTTLSNEDIKADDLGRNRETTRATRERINSVTSHLYKFAGLVAALEVDNRNVALALDEVRRSFPAANRPGSPQPWPVDRLDLLARQISADVDYARITVASGDRLLQKHLILGELEETHATERLTKLGMIVGAMLGAMQITTDVGARSLFLAAGVILCGVLYREELTAWRWSWVAWVKSWLGASNLKR